MSKKSRRRESDRGEEENKIRMLEKERLQLPNSSQNRNRLLNVLGQDVGQLFSRLDCYSGTCCIVNSFGDVP